MGLKKGCIQIRTEASFTVGGGKTEQTKESEAASATGTEKKKHPDDKEVFYNMSLSRVNL